MSKVKKWWSKLKYLQKGGLIGFVLGFLKIPFFTLLGEGIPEIIGNLVFQFPDQFFCNLFSFGMGEPCGSFVFFYGMIYNPLVYGIIGGIIGFTIEHFKKK